MHDNRQSTTPYMMIQAQHQRVAHIKLSDTLLAGCQSVIRASAEYRTMYSLDQLACDRLREATPRELHGMAHKCIYAFRPARSIRDILSRGSTTQEASCARDMLPVARIAAAALCATYLFTVQRLAVAASISCALLNVSRDEVDALVGATPQLLQLAALRGPYFLVPSWGLRGLLGGSGTPRPDELRRWCTIDVAVNAQT